MNQPVHAFRLLVLAVLALSARELQAQGITVALNPPERTVAPGDTFSVELDVTQPGTSFNGFDAVIGYDPAALTFLPRSPLSLQEGTTMTGACGNTFHVFSAAGDSLAISDVLLCNGVSLTGPGQLYRVRFQASTRPQVTWIRIRSIQFYNAGLYVNPAFPADAAVGVGIQLGVGAPQALPRVRVSAAPNPCGSSVQFRLESADASPARLDVLDVTGHVVRHWAGEGLGPGVRAVSWDARDDRGVRVAPGLYFVRFTRGASVASTRVAVIP